MTDRLTNDVTADELRANIEALSKVGIFPSMADLRYVRLAEYERSQRNSGEWVWDSNAPHREHGAYKCSNCGCHSDFEEYYCYNCGAKMKVSW